MDTSHTDMILFKLSGIPVTFVSCYVPPRDSPYFTMDNISLINEKLQCDSSPYVILGDFNARYADLRNYFLSGTPSSLQLQYTIPTDPTQKPNDNAQLLVGVLSDCTVLLNCLEGPGFCHSNAMTFRQSNRWISELDHVYVSNSLVTAVDNLTVHDDLSLPSNHAPVSVALDIGKIDTSLPRAENLKFRSAQLDDHTTAASASPFQRHRQIRMSDVDPEQIRYVLNNTDPPTIEYNDVDGLFENIDNHMRFALQNAERQPSNVPSDTVIADRWERVTRLNDPKELWNAIGWNGSLNDDPERNNRPSDIEFKEHFEKLLNSAEPPGDLISEVPPDLPYIPITDDGFTYNEVQDAINSLKSDRSGGPSGIPPGVLKLLPPSWIIFFTTIFLLFCVMPQSLEIGPMPD